MICCSKEWQCHYTWFWTIQGTIVHYYEAWVHQWWPQSCFMNDCTSHQSSLVSSNTSCKHFSVLLSKLLRQDISSFITFIISWMSLIACWRWTICWGWNWLDHWAGVFFLLEELCFCFFGVMPIVSCAAWWGPQGESKDFNIIKIQGGSFGILILLKWYLKMCNIAMNCWWKELSNTCWGKVRQRWRVTRA